MPPKIDPITLYRNSEDSLRLNRKNAGEDPYIVHPDDHLDGLTEIHLFQNKKKAEGFQLGLEFFAEKTSEEITVTDPEKIPNQPFYGIIAEYPNREFSEREPKIIIHP